MIEARHGFAATLLLDGRVLVTGGSGDGTSAELYDPESRTWSATGSMHVGRIHTTMLLLDGRVLVAGGFVGDGGPILGSAELYDPVTGVWTLTADLIVARAGFATTRL